MAHFNIKRPFRPNTAVAACGLLPKAHDLYTNDIKLVTCPGCLDCITALASTIDRNIHLKFNTPSPNDMVGDKYVEASVALLRSRSAAGLKKYGVTLERKDLTLREWLAHAEEEAADFLNYIQVIKSFIPPWLLDSKPCLDAPPPHSPNSSSPASASPPTG